MARCPPALPSAAKARATVLPGIFSVPVISHNDDQGLILNARNNTPGDVMDLEQEFRNDHQDVRTGNFVQMGENSIFDHILARRWLFERIAGP